MEEWECKRRKGGEGIRETGKKECKKEGGREESRVAAHFCTFHSAFRCVSPRSLLFRCSPEFPNLQPKNFQARAAIPPNAIALAANICMFSHYICFDQLQLQRVVKYFEFTF